MLGFFIIVWVIFMPLAIGWIMSPELTGDEILWEKLP